MTEVLRVWVFSGGPVIKMPHFHFPGGLDGKESACHAGDLGSIPGLGRAPGGGHGICLQCRRLGFNPWVGKSTWRRAWHLPAMQETWVQSLCWEEPLEEGMTTHSVFLPGEFHGQRSLAGYSPWGHRVGHDGAAKHTSAAGGASSVPRWGTKVL